jgi:hypothetical protein
MDVVPDRQPLRKLDNFRRGELKRLLLHRGYSKIEVHNAVEDIMAERVRWTCTALGERVRLTFKEKIRLSIRTIACVDRTKKMVKLYYLERRRERDRRRRRIDNMQVQMARETNGLSARARQLAAALKSDWMSSHTLADAMKEKWRLRHNAALRMAALRASRELCEAGIAERKVEPGPKGGYLTFMRRSATNTGTSQRQNARSADKIRAARSGDKICSTEQSSPNKNIRRHRRSAGKPGTPEQGTLH